MDDLGDVVGAFIGSEIGGASGRRMLRSRFRRIWAWWVFGSLVVVGFGVAAIFALWGDSAIALGELAVTVGAVSLGAALVVALALGAFTAVGTVIEWMRPRRAGRGRRARSNP